jgi:hypothetical protein
MGAGFLTLSSFMGMGLGLAVRDCRRLQVQTYLEEQ